MRQVRLRTMLIATAAIAVVMGVYTQNVAKRDRRYRRQWEAWRAAIAERDAVRASNYSRQATLDKLKALESAQRAEKFPAQADTWKEEANYWMKRASHDASLADKLQQASSLAPSAEEDAPSHRSQHGT